MLFTITSKIKDLADHIANGWPKKLEEGRFTTYCKTQGFKGPCKGCADKAMDSKDPSVRGMASWYVNTVLKQKDN
jgi:hypothetical protein